MPTQTTALTLLALLALACDVPPDPCDGGCETTSTGGETTDTTSGETTDGPSDTTETGEEVSTFVCCSCSTAGTGVDTCVPWLDGADACQIDLANAEGVELVWCALVDGVPLDCDSACMPPAETGDPAAGLCCTCPDLATSEYSCWDAKPSECAENWCLSEFDCLEQC